MQILADLFVITRKGHQANVPSLIEIDGTKWQSNDLKMAGFFTFLQKSLFEI